MHRKMYHPPVGLTFHLTFLAGKRFQESLFQRIRYPIKLFGVCQHLHSQQFQSLPILLYHGSRFVDDHDSRFHKIHDEFIIFLPLDGFLFDALQDTGDAIQHRIHFRSILVHHLFVEMHSRVVVLDGIEQKSYLAGVVGVQPVEAPYRPYKGRKGHE